MPGVVSFRGEETATVADRSPLEGTDLMTSRHPRRLRRTGALALTTAALLLAGAPAHAATSTTTDPAEAAAGWLATQLVDGDHLEVTFDGTSYADYGLTADAVLALDAAGVAQDAAARATGYLAADVGAYAGDGEKESYAGSLAKLLNVAVAQGRDPEEFGGVDLVARLSALECGPARPGCPAADLGRFSDKSAYGDYSNGIGHSLALIGLERATTTGPSAASVAYLVGQQCEDGSFPETFGQATCTASVDTTGFAVQALALTGGAGAQQAVDDAVAWLKSVQRTDGSFVGNEVANSNTTALAAQALDAAGESAAAERAVAFVAGLQAGCDAATADEGQVAYDAEGKGDPARATTQAAPALAGVTLAEITADGATADAPRLDCPSAVPTTAPAPTPAPTGTTGTGGTAVQGVKTGGTDLTQGGTILADTGASPGLAALGAGLVLLGVALVRLGRPRSHES